MMGEEEEEVCIVDYGVGNVRSVLNAVRSVGHTFRLAQNANDIHNARKIIFPGVGNFAAVERLEKMGLREALIKYIRDDRPFLGICVGMQSLFEGSEEAPGVKGLGIIPGLVRLFKEEEIAVPHMGWNGIVLEKTHSTLLSLIDKVEDAKVYFVHSYYGELTEATKPWMLTSTNYGSTTFISAVHKGNVMGVQFHPEKSGVVGLRLIEAFLSVPHGTSYTSGSSIIPRSTRQKTVFCRRIIAALDVRSNDAGDLVVTKGDQYDVREKAEIQTEKKHDEEEGGKRNVRNLGKPAELAFRYFKEGADEIAFLNITSFRNFPLKDTPMLELLKITCERVFIPVTVGGGIRDFVDENNRHYSALEVADEYFRSGADKISIGSDAVMAAEAYIRSDRRRTNSSSIEQISRVYGAQAVVVSIDPRRVYVDSADAVRHHTIPTMFPGPKGEKFCWYQCTVKGGRENRDIGAWELAKACEELGAGEIMLNCIDKDGTNTGYDCELVNDIKKAVSIPVVASSGAGKVEHFLEMFLTTHADAALAAGIFHRNEVKISAVKQF